MKLTKRLNQKVKLLMWLVTAVTQPLSGIAQTLDLATCQKLARTTSPLKRQERYLASIDMLKQQTTQNAWLPDFSLQGKASYQSDVFGLPFEMAGVDIPEIPKDQYQLSLNITQNIYDGGVTKASKQLSTVNYRTKTAQLEVSLYQVRAVINELYFDILAYKENEKILQSTMQELDNQIRKANSALSNGTLLPSELKSLQKQKLSIQQQINGLKIQQNALLVMLSDWTGQEIDLYAELILPISKSTPNEINRPELSAYRYQMEELNLQESLIAAQSRPKISAFATGGYANPNPYNYFDTNWSNFYVIGGKLEWKFWDWNNTRKQQQILSLNQEIVRTQQENFEKNVRNDLVRQSSEIDLLETSLKTDLDLFILQKDITESASARFARGVITATDYLSELNALTQAELQYELHQIKLVKSKIEFQTLSGNTP